MSRKTISIAAIATVAAASLTFPGLDSAAALANAANDDRVMAPAVEPVELVPEAPVFIAQAVVQPLPAETPTSTPDQVLTEAGSLA